MNSLLFTKNQVPDKKFNLLIAIPCLEESDYLPRTLASLEKSSELNQALIAINVNNRQDASDKSKADNQTTLEYLQNYSGSLTITWLDCASAGREIPAKRGVGYARKILIDSCLPLCQKNALISWLDADTLVAENHIQNLLLFEKNTPKFRAGYIDFEHQKPDCPKQQLAIDLYQRHLFYYEEACRRSLSPYAYQTVGSTLLCRANEYRKCSGTLNKRLAGEDFYFAQQLAKTGSILQKIAISKVFPSARFSDRVPFGTGKSIAQILEGDKPSLKTYNPHIFVVLKQFIHLVESNLEKNGSNLEDLISAELPTIAHFVKDKKLAENWDKLQKNSINKEMLKQRFHEWFDAFATLKFVHYLSEKEFPEIAVNEAEILLEEYLP